MKSGLGPARADEDVLVDLVGHMQGIGLGIQCCLRHLYGASHAAAASPVVVEEPVAGAVRASAAVAPCGRLGERRRVDG